MPNVATTLLYRWFNAVWNQGNEFAIDELMTEDAIAHGISGDGLRGPEGFKGFYHEFREQFDNINITVHDVVSEGDLESARCTVRATKRGSNIPVSFDGNCTVRVENGKIAEAWNYFDFLGMNQQLGMKLVPQEGALAQ